jgi:hypothetical protein
MIQLFWFRRVRNIPLLFVLSLLVNVGMWLERFIIIVTSPSRLPPSSWDIRADAVGLRLFTGTIGLFRRSSSRSSACRRSRSRMRTIVPQAKLQPEHRG